jgi:hypothetical protein
MVVPCYAVCCVVLRSVYPVFGRLNPAAWEFLRNYHPAFAGSHKVREIESRAPAGRMPRRPPMPSGMLNPAKPKPPCSSERGQTAVPGETDYSSHICSAASQTVPAA